MALAGVPYTIVTPTKWKPAVDTGADKEASRQRCSSFRIKP
jgi:hypothetical protein